jgi:hypothetical protein
LIVLATSEFISNLVYIHPYRPNLNNIIERFWKHIKSKHQTKYAEIKNKEAVASLIMEKIQLFDDLVPRKIFSMCSIPKVRLAARTGCPGNKGLLGNKLYNLRIIVTLN